jgi:uncharacterized protein with HEPN domain
MITDRNNVAHTYKEETAQSVYQHIKAYAPELRRLCNFLNNRFKT